MVLNRIGAEAFASDWIESLGVVSMWLYGPITVTTWGLLSFVAYLLITRAERRNPALCPEHEEATREARGAATGELRRGPKRIEEVDALEKDKLAGLMGGFAITIAAWLGVLSFAPIHWLDSIASISPWIYCLASMAVWLASAELMYQGFRRGRQAHTSIHHAPGV